ncbi:MAG: alpha/beta hydrolase [bacterium]
MYEELDVESYRVETPSIFNSLTEIPRTLLEIGTLSISFPVLSSLPKGDKHPVMLVPGFMAGDESTVVLRRYLSCMGYKPSGWGLGRNTGHPEIIERTLIEKFHQLFEEHQQKVSLIGQSLGGIFARELGRLFPDKVRQVITLGSPFSMANGGGSNLLVQKLFEQQSRMSVEMMRERLETDQSPPIPLTAVYSRGDGVVHWRGCMETELDHQTQNIEVFGSHCGMGFNPAVYYIIADRLAQPENRWRLFQSRVPGVVHPMNEDEN